MAIHLWRKVAILERCQVARNPAEKPKDRKHEQDNRKLAGRPAKTGKPITDKKPKNDNVSGKGKNSVPSMFFALDVGVQGGNRNEAEKHSVDGCENRHMRKTA
ncbi:MAG TPA: hypothetical protein VH598_08605 [Verrucomicrobiae bacterium]|nr:hypothetical protein [Verrucomicrobiae bacterium]